MKASAGRTMMFVENAYPQDTRVRNECQMLVCAGYSVTVVALCNKGQMHHEVIDGVRVFRLPKLELFQKTPAVENGVWARLVLRLKSAFGYATEYLYFTVASLGLSVYVAVRYGFDVIHAHNPPDTLFLVALPYKFFGKHFIYDQHDLSPELYQSRYGTKRDLISKVLELLEWVNLRMADITIATNESYERIQRERGGRPKESIFIVRNGPASDRMEWVEPDERLRGMGKTILCYIGSLNPQDGVDYLVRALCLLVKSLGRTDFHCVIMGSGDSLDELRDLVNALGLQEYVELPGFVPDLVLRRNLMAADICVDPDPSSPLNDCSTWIKVMEYMAAAKPIVAFDLPETRVSAQEAALYVRCNDELEFATAIAGLMNDPERRKSMGLFARNRVEKDLQWSIVGRQLLQAYDALGLGVSQRVIPEKDDLTGSEADRMVQQRQEAKKAS